MPDFTITTTIVTTEAIINKRITWTEKESKKKINSNLSVLRKKLSSKGKPSSFRLLGKQDQDIFCYGYLEGTTINKNIEDIQLDPPLTQNVYQDVIFLKYDESVTSPSFEMIQNLDNIDANTHSGTGELVENSKDEIDPDLYLESGEDEVGLDDEQNKTIVKQLSYEKINEDIAEEEEEVIICEDEDEEDEEEITIKELEFNDELQIEDYNYPKTFTLV